MDLPVLPTYKMYYCTTFGPPTLGGAHSLPECTHNGAHNGTVTDEYISYIHSKHKPTHIPVISVSFINNLRLILNATTIRSKFA